jgi:hypothetical protein
MVPLVISQLLVCCKILCVIAISTHPHPAEDLVHTTVPASLSADGQQYSNTTNVLQLPPLPIQDYVPTSPSTPFRVLSLRKLHHMDPTLSSWLKNMDKLSGLVGRLDELASFAPAEQQSQLSRQVATLRATFNKQQKRGVEFLQLSEEYASKYLLDISAEIRRETSFLDMLEQRLGKAKLLRHQAVDLRRAYESGIVAIMKDVCATGKAFSSSLQRQNAEIYNFQCYRSLFQKTLTC